MGGKGGLIEFQINFIYFYAAADFMFIYLFILEKLGRQ